MELGGHDGGIVAGAADLREIVHCQGVLAKLCVQSGAQEVRA